MTTMQSPAKRDTASCCAYCGVDEAIPVLDATAQQEAIRKIMEHDFANVRAKILADEALPQNVVDEAIAEYRRFLILHARGNYDIGMTSPEVDEVWHTHILFTRQYGEFCREVFGHFMHHRPSLPDDPMGPEPRERFIEAYTAEFGEIPSIWGIQKSLQTTCGSMGGCRSTN